DRLNRERRKIEAGMLKDASAALDAGAEASSGTALTLCKPEWHQGVVGLIASRVKERIHKPTICFAKAENGELRGSGRLIPGFHLRDCLDLVAKRAPGVMLRFGGHAPAAGLTIKERDFDRFRELFERTTSELLPEDARTRVVEHDGALEAGYHSLSIPPLLEGQGWGRGFPAPLFCDRFRVESQRVVGERHLRLRLLKDGRRLEAMRFNSLGPLPSSVLAAYRIGVNEFNGLKSVQLTVEHAEAAS